MAQLANWPTITDDSGQGQDGTPVDKAYSDAVKASVEDNIHSANNSTIKCKDIIDEVKNARGSAASVDARLDVEHNEDGTHKALSYASVAQLQQQLAGVNLMRNSSLYMWNGSTVPFYFYTSGSVVRDDSGSNMKVGLASAKINNGYLNQFALDAAVFDNIFQNFYYSCGAWMKTSYASCGKLTSSFNPTGVTHNGDGTWQFLTLTGSGSGLAHLGMTVESLLTQDVWTDGWVMLISPVAPDGWRPSPCRVDTVRWEIAGTLATGTIQKIAHFYRPAVIKDVYMQVKTGPTGAALIVDINKDGASSVFDSGASRPQIGDGQAVGGGRPGGSDTFYNRCINAAIHSVDTGSITLDIDQVGSGTAGADLFMDVRYLEYVHPLEEFQSYDDVE
ncbi:MAG: hypothetical protein ACFFFO_16460 [Candidatus Thorarchaeota archaeon]